ncbi:MAG: RDD family protein [Bacilli bacterium]
MVYAVLYQRFLAFMLDYLLIAALVKGVDSWGILSIPPSLEVTATIVGFVIYQTIFTWSPWNASLGKKLMGIKVVSTIRPNITYFNAFVRSTGMLFSAITLFIGFAMMLFTKQSQTLHDLMGKTIVIQEKNVDDRLQKRSEAIQKKKDDERVEKLRSSMKRKQK